MQYRGASLPVIALADLASVGQIEEGQAWVVVVFEHGGRSLGLLAAEPLDMMESNLVVDRPNQVWAMDITYIPMARGFVYLAAVVDWFSRRVLAWKLSITLEVEFCLDAVNEALARHGRPGIFNTDQGSQFTSAAFTGLLQANAIAISMDGRGAWRDNVFVERLWRSVKYEEVYLRAYESVSDARGSLGRYLDFYNCRRPHSSLGARTPEQAYLDHLPQSMAA